MISREKAEVLLEEAKKLNPGPWYNHSKVVAKCAESIACQMGVDYEKAYVLGLLHDIGRRFGVTHLAHVYDGYEFLLALGEVECAKIALTHSFAVQDISTYIGRIDISQEKVETLETVLTNTNYDDYDRLIQLCDAISMAEGVVDIEVRMRDVEKRYGQYPQAKWDKHIELKVYFEDKIGKKLEEILK